MRILISSHVFAPSVGGIETVSALLAEEFIRLGHEVKVVTQSPGGEYPCCEVIRRPGPCRLFRLVWWCEVFFHNNISLQTAWPLMLLRRPWVIAHHTWLCSRDRRVRMRDRLKRFAARFATDVSISQAIADHLPVASRIIGNPYRDDLFREMPEMRRDGDVLFLGRLVSDKGADLLLEAVAKLEHDGIAAGLTIIGDGPERANLQQQARTLGIAERVRFEGIKQGEELVERLNAHRILALPSRWAEPFGIVAIEGIAAGCAVVGSEQGGLKEAIGPCGVTFPNGDAGALAEALVSLLKKPADRDRRGREEHLGKFRREAAAKAYLEVFTEALQ